MTVEGVPKVQRIASLISNAEARLLAKELNAAKLRLHLMSQPFHSTFQAGIKSSAHTAELHMHG